MWGFSTLDEEKEFHRILSLVVIGVSIPILFLEIPISKTTASWSWLGPCLPARLAWFLFESPNLFWPLLCTSTALNEAPSSSLPRINAILLGLFVLHYLRRTIIFPFRMSSSSQGVPLAVVACALIYTSVNGYLQARALCTWEKYDENHLFRPMSLLGWCLFGYGAYVNVQGDATLRDLKLQNKGYQIPRGGWFEYVSAPHYFGEILEWIGFALLAWNLAAVSFCVFTAANLIPRGRAQHQWYQSKFEDYPPNRRAVIPFLL